MANHSGESDLRRRAAWLLAMLAVVAVLFVILLTTLLHTSGNGGGGQGAGPDDTLTPTTSSTSTPSGPSKSPGRSAVSTSSAPGSSSTHGSASCPTNAACALDYDVGNAVAAINAYRVQNNQQEVPGLVSKAAQRCALGNGSGCSGGYAESQVQKPTGKAAVAKISKLGKLLDPSMKSFEVGWAYDPGTKQYFFAVIRND